jgi:SAM-dependent methyltransferase
VPLTTFLSPKGTYEGFDVVAVGIDWCVKKITPRYPNFHFQRADIYNRHYNPTGKYKGSEYQFPYESESFNFVFLTSVFTHLLPADLENYLSEIARVLKPKGRCLITFFLLNQESAQLIADQNSHLDFKYSFGKYKVLDLTMPEAGICYDEKFVLHLYQKYGLDLIEPIHYGGWCFRSQFTSFQDIILAEKSTQPISPHSSKLLADQNEDLDVLIATDESLSSIVSELRKRIWQYENENRQLQARLVSLDEALAWQQGQLEQVRATKVYRLGMLYWRAKAWFKGLWK